MMCVDVIYKLQWLIIRQHELFINVTLHSGSRGADYFWSSCAANVTKLIPTV